MGVVMCDLSSRIRALPAAYPVLESAMGASVLVMDDEERGPWFVRVIENKLAVGVYTCNELELADLVDEATEPDLCEYKKLDSGGFVFAGAYVLHEPASQEEVDDAPYMDGCSLTESWETIYNGDGPWHRLDAMLFDNDD